MSVDLEYVRHVAIITIKNSDKLGALTHDMILQLGHHLRAAAECEDVYITLLIGTGRFFSAYVLSTYRHLNCLLTKSLRIRGASIHENREPGPDEDRRLKFVQHFAGYLDIAQTFYTHSNILVTALNGPVMGLASALISHSDFIYAAPHTFLLSPFNSIGIPVECAATRSMINRMGVSKAKEALLMAKKISIDELLSCGFVNGVFDADPSGKKVEKFKQTVLKEICEERLGDHLSSWSMLKTKQVMSRLDEITYDSQVVRELLGGVAAFESGYPQKQFAKLRTKEKRHKL